MLKSILHFVFFYENLTKISQHESKSGLFPSRSRIGRDSGFSSKIGESPDEIRGGDGWTVWCISRARASHACFLEKRSTKKLRVTSLFLQTWLSSIDSNSLIYYFRVKMLTCASGHFYGQLYPKLQNSRTRTCSLDRTSKFFGFRISHS